MNPKYTIGFLISFITSLLYSLSLEQIVPMVFSLLSFFLFYIYNIRKYSKQYTLVYLLIISLPFSFIPLFGDSFLSMFVLLQIIIIMTFFSKSPFFKNDKLFNLQITTALFLMVFIFLIGVITHGYFSLDIIIKTALLVLLLYTVSFKFSFSLAEVNSLIKLYVLIGIISALLVLIQFVLFYFFNIDVFGNQRVIGGGRLGFSALFYDYSILSVYLASMSFLVLFSFFSGKLYFSKLINLLLFILFTATSVITSARSGIFSLFIMMFVALFYFRKFKMFCYTLLLSVPSFYLIMEIFSITRAKGVVYDSGRLNNFNDVLSYIYDNIFFGAKFLGYSTVANSMSAHNFILDFLSQYGFFYTILLFSIFIFLIKYSYKTIPILSFLLVFYFLGGLFHTSLINTHYILFPIILIISLKNRNENPSYNH